MKCKWILLILVLFALTACTTDHEAMQQRLKYVSDCNRADTVFTERWLPTVDSLVSYFDRHGSANDRMMAHYVQGRVYHDMGEAPQALECYQKAAEQADTTSNDCDFYTLSSVYSQLATVFYRQLLLSNEIDARKKASHYAFLANIVGLAVKPGLCRLAYLGYCPTARMGQVDAGRRRDSAFCSRVRGLHSADESNAALDVVVCIQRWQQVCYSAVLSIDGLCRP